MGEKMHIILKATACPVKAWKGLDILISEIWSANSMSQVFLKTSSYRSPKDKGSSREEPVLTPLLRSAEVVSFVLV